MNELSIALLTALSESKTESPTDLGQDYFSGIAQLLKPIARNLESIADDLGAAVNEAIQVLNSPITTPAEITAMKNYTSWFGRETIYYNLVRSDEATT